MTKLASLAFAIALLVAAAFPALGQAEEGGGPPAEPPQLTFPQAPLELAKTTVGTQSTTVTVTVHNSGTTTAAIDKVTVEGPDAGEFKFSGSDCGSLSPGQDCSAYLAFAPGSPGVKEVDLVVQPKEFPAQTTPVSATAVPAQIALGPSSYDFGIRRTNESASTWFQLTNSGEAFVEVASIGIGGPSTGNFWTDNSDCWNGRRLDPGESCNLRVNFNPWDAVHYEAELQASANGASAGAALAGTGGRAMLEPEANPISLGSAAAGSVGSVQTINLANNGNIAGGYFIGVIAGGDAGSFELLDESCTGRMVAPGDSCVAHVRLTPLSVGTKVARLAFFGDGEGGTLVQIEGEGVAPAVTLTPGAFDFGGLVVGERSAAHAFAIRNQGDQPLRLGSVTLVGTDLDQFALAGDECSQTILEPGGECAIRVRFAPSEEGLKGAKLRVGGEAGALFGLLSGSGLAAGSADRPAESTEAPQGSAVPSTASNRNRARRHRFTRGSAIVSRARPSGRVADGARPARRGDR
ncbi:MAG: choice-of-anchor D domain-containing protein [Solirubrobacterales bacterium]